MGRGKGRDEIRRTFEIMKILSYNLIIRDLTKTNTVTSVRPEPLRLCVDDLRDGPVKPLISTSNRERRTRNAHCF